MPEVGDGHGPLEPADGEDAVDSGGGDLDDELDWEMSGNEEAVPPVPDADDVADFEDIDEMIAVFEEQQHVEDLDEDVAVNFYHDDGGWASEEAEDSQVCVDKAQADDGVPLSTLHRFK